MSFYAKEAEDAHLAHDDQYRDETPHVCRSRIEGTEFRWSMVCQKLQYASQCHQVMGLEMSVDKHCIDRRSEEAETLPMGSYLHKGHR